MANYVLKVGTRDSSGTVTTSDVDYGTSKVNVDRLTVSLDSPRELIFTQINRLQWDGEFEPGQWVEFYDHASETSASRSLFKGKIVDRQVDGSPGQISVTYICKGPRHIASNEVTVMNEIATAARTDDVALPFITYNARRGDPDYNESREWMTIGDIIKDLFDNCSAGLFAAGAAASATAASNYDTAELAYLTTTPPEPVVFSNTGFTAAIEQLMEYMPQFVWYVDAGTMKWHFRNIEATASPYGVTDLNIQLADTASYLVMSDNIRETVQECATRYVVHGGKKTETTEFFFDPDDPTNSTLVKGWDPDLEDDWTMQGSFHRRATDYAGGPPDKTILTSVTTVTYPSTSSITIDGMTFDDDIYKGGWIEFLSSDTAPANQIEHRYITAHSNDSSDETFTFTPVLLMDTSEVFSIRLIQPVNQMWYVWRKFDIRQDFPDPGDINKVAEISDPWMAVAGGRFDTNITPTLQAEITVDESTFRLNAAAEVTNDGKSVIAQFPLCTYVMKPSDMYVAGKLAGPDKVYLTAPKEVGNLTAIWPRNTNLSDPSDPRSGDTPAYEGTAKTRFGIEVTRDHYIPSWKNDQQQQLFDDLSSQRLKPIRDVQMQGTIPISGFKEAFLLRNTTAATTSFPHVVTITLPPSLSSSDFTVSGIPVSSSAAYDTTNWEDMLVKSATYTWARTGAPAITTNISIDNNMREGRTADELLFAVENASTFIELRYDFDAVKPGHIGTMVIGIDQRIANPDLMR